MCGTSPCSYSMVDKFEDRVSDVGAEMVFDEDDISVNQEDSIKINLIDN